jgi:acyl carrier protein
MTANTEIAERLRVTLAKELKQNISSITPEHTLRGDLKLNSLDAIELMFRIEEEFDLTIPDEDIQGFATVGDVIDYLEHRLAGAPAAMPTPKAAVAAPSATQTPVLKAVVAAPRATPAPKAAARKAKPKAARRRA